MALQLAQAMSIGLELDGFPWGSSNLLALSLWIGYGVRVLFGSVVLLIVSIYEFFVDRVYVIKWLFQKAIAVFWWGLYLVKAALWILITVVRLITLFIFNPLLITVRIIDYNTRQFANLVLGFLFDTTVERVLSFEYGVQNFKLFVKWMQFFNVLCLTALVLGLLTYYSVVRFVFKWTEYEKSLSKKPKGKRIIKKDLTFKEINTDVAHNNEKKILIDEFLKQEKSSNDLVKEEVEQIKTKPRTQFIKQEAILFDELPSEAEEDDITNYQSLNSLSNPVSASSSLNNIFDTTSTPMKYTSPSPQTQQNLSPLTLAFRSRLLNSNKRPLSSDTYSSAISNYSDDDDYRDSDFQENTITDRGTTVTSSIFTTNRAPTTSITTIEEEEDEEIK